MSRLCAFVLIGNVMLASIGVSASRIIKSEEKAAFWDYDDDGNRAAEKYQCDRECQWQNGFWDRTIVGNRVGPWGSRLPNVGSYCLCYQGVPTNEDPVGGACCAADDAECIDCPSNRPQVGGQIDRTGKKQFDINATWSGSGDSGFDSQFACVETKTGELETWTLQQAQTAKEQGARSLHCGACAACSTYEDMLVLSKTRNWITSVMTATSAEFAKPTGHGDLKRLQQNLYDLGISFSMSRPDKRTDLPTCMDVWTDNIMCDSINCKMNCMGKFFNPDNTGKSIEEDGCLKCDEDYCGPQFIKGAGANRRSSGIISDIPRPKNQECKMGVFTGVSEENLPTSPKPTDEEMYAVLCPGGWHGVLGTCGFTS